MTPQTYLSGEEVRLGDIVKWPSDEGVIVALQDELSRLGLGAKEAKGKAMIEFKKVGLVCQPTASEDLKLVRRADAQAG
jgi:hypothetical protein